MTKGKNFAPIKENDGIWFHPRGASSNLNVGHTTSTRSMLEAPFSAPIRPPSPPILFQQKVEDLLSQQYPFTQHDNRHFFENKGEYFGNGSDTRFLGRRLHPQNQRLHHTDCTFLHHKSREPTQYDYNPITAVSYQPPGETEAPTRRRFPKMYALPKIPADWKTSHLTTWSASTYRTPLSLLAVSQEPFLSHNPWNYCYHGNTKAYPPYERKKSPPVPNILNRYGPDFAMNSSEKTT